MKANSLTQNILWSLVLSVLFISCGQDVNSPSETSNKTMPLASKAFLNSDGYVRTPENYPISGVVIKKGKEIIAKSDKEGYFTIEDTTLKEGEILSFEHSEFISVTKVISSDSKLIIWMKERGEGRILDSRKGGRIALEKGGEVRIPQNAFSFRGAPYEGEVEIRASYIDVTDANEVRTAPGSYIAFDERQNNLVPLTSFGMVEITAVIPEIEAPLELSKGRSISVILPILTEETPDTVNLYEFDAAVGYWVLEGELRNIENTLQGEITSVNSAWNADEPCSETLICVKVKVIFQNGNPGCGVGATGVSYQGFDGLHSIGADDYVELMVCPDSVFELGACWLVCCGPGTSPSDPCCNNPQYKTNIDMSTITINPSGCTDIGTWVVPN